jgi:hypothetical protein
MGVKPGVLCCAAMYLWQKLFAITQFAVIGETGENSSG